MKLPNKVTSYKESVLYKIPLVLKKLSVSDYLVIDLYHELSQKMTIDEFTDVLVILYALKKIKMIGEVIYYVERNIL